MSDAPGDTPVFTVEQRSALGGLGASIALSAGAGCGKTLVLTERFLRHLGGDGLPACTLSRLVTLTFTDKAARELRERLRQASRARLARGSDNDRRAWRTVLRGLEAAPIGTFHSFCGEMLRRFPIEAGVEPGFAIAEESIAPSIRDDALADCIRRWLAEGDEDFTTLAIELGLPQLREALSRLIRLRTRGEFHEWGRRDADEIVALWDQAWRRRVVPMIVARYMELARPLLEVLARHECSHPTMRERIAFLRESIPTLAGHPDPFPIFAEIQDKAQVQGGGGKSKWTSEDVYSLIREALKTLREEARKISRATWDKETTRHGAEIAARLARLAVRAAEWCDRAKRDQGLLDFDDMLLRARRLLDDPPDSVHAWLAEAVGFLLVDEFQDTDPIQGEIVRRLAGEGLDAGRLFLVGDTKQSIYRFRGARPDVFEVFRDGFPETGRLQLTENFRSRPEVLDFVNALFADAFPGGPHLLHPGPGSPAHDGRVAVEFLWAHESGEDDDAEDSTQVGVDQRRRLEARWIARHLRRRLDEGWPVRDRPTKAVRNAHPGDVVLLFRSLNDAAAYETALAREGLEYHVVGGAAFYGQQEVLDLINLLSAIEDPFDDLALAATLRSPFGCLSDEGLYWLATSAHGELSLGLEHWTEIPALSEVDRTRAGRFQRLLTSWRALKDRSSIASLVERCLDDSGYEAALLGEFLGERRRANVRKLLRLARRYDSQGGLTLADFVARLRADFLDPPREDEAATTDEAGEAVRLMTIHQAKGLEFPIVVLPDLNRQAPGSRAPIAFHPELGPILKPPEDDSTVEPKGQGESLGRLVLKEFDRKEEADEALCVFYVAATRARDALVLSAGMAPDERPKSPAMRLLDERFDRSTGSCRVAVEGCTPPQVRVIAAEPSPVESDRRSSRPQVPRMRLVARIIDRTRPAPVAPKALPPPRPRLLDLDPCRILPPHAARVVGLMRAILADPGALQARSLPSLVRHHARLQSPSAPRRVEIEARDLLAPWLQTGFAHALAASGRVLRPQPWVCPWPTGHDAPMVVRGILDFAFLDGEGRWTLLQLAHPEAPPPLERLRLAMSARYLASLDGGTIARGWLVPLGRGGQPSEHRRFGDEELEVALDEVLHYVADPHSRAH